MRDILLGVIIIKMKKVNIKQVMLGTAALAGLMVTSQAVANADSMTIKPGDTVWAYSQKYHVSIDQIVKQNKLGSADFIVAGQKINIPGVKTSDSSKTNTASASTVKSTSAATTSAASSQATSAVATSSSVTSASSTSEAASSSVVSSSAAVQSSTSTASVSSSVASSAAATSQSSSVVSSASQSTASQGSTSNASTSTASTTNTATSNTATSNTYRAAASSTTYTRAASTTTQSSTTTNTNVSASSAISAAYTLVGTPYEVLDCSAFTQKAFAMAGQSIGRTTYAQATLGAHVSFSQAQAGDLVFWGSDSAPYHVAIYLGGGQYIGAHTYGDPASVKSTAYYTPSFAIHM